MVDGLNTYEKSLICAKVALDKRAFNLVILEVGHITTLADYFLLLSGSSNRQVQTIASSIEAAMKNRRIYALGMEGLREGRWVLIDYNDLVVHVFLEPVRDFYDLERLWMEAHRLDEAEVLKAAEAIA